MAIYVWGQPQAVSIVGMAHGVLFMAYVALASHLAIERQWGLKMWAFGMMAAVFPLGTFIFERSFAAELNGSP